METTDKPALMSREEITSFEAGNGTVYPTMRKRLSYMAIKALELESREDELAEAEMLISTIYDKAIEDAAQFVEAKMSSLLQAELSASAMSIVPNQIRQLKGTSND